MPFCAGIIHGHKPTPGVSLPLLWFDRLLRRYGALLPAPILALRAASVLLTPGAQERVANGSAAAGSAGEPAAWLWRRREFGEALVVYAGVTVVRWWVYGLHQAGKWHAAARTMCMTGGWLVLEMWLVLCLTVGNAVSSRQVGLPSSPAKRIAVALRALMPVLVMEALTAFGACGCYIDSLCRGTRGL